MLGGVIDGSIALDDDTAPVVKDTLAILASKVCTHVCSRVCVCVCVCVCVYVFVHVYSMLLMCDNECTYISVC